MLAEECCQRDIRTAGDGVPDGDIDGGDRIDLVTALVTTAPLQVVEKAPHRGRILEVTTLEQGCEQVAGDLADDLGKDGRVGLAPADMAVGELDAHHGTLDTARVDRAPAIGE
ncbi:MAG: hypothetical protein R3D25_09685 [Geminicoccaceae bacterium]